MTTSALIFMVYFAAVNLIAFIVCGIDKYKAQHDLWRVPEKTLFLLSVIGGALGFFFGMKSFRHKTRHLKFQILIPLLALLWIGIIVFLQMRFALFF